jgi:hypothetical protein
MKQLVMALALLMPFAAQAQTKPAKPVKPAKAVKATPAPVYKNGIKIKSNGFVLSEAALYFDDGSSVPPDNTVEVNQRVNLQLIIEKGWNEVDGKVYPGGSEVIKLNTGAVVLQSDDLFKAYEETGVSPDDARYITLKAIITEMADKRKYVIVTFKVWDKKGKSVLTGSYRLNIK